MTQVRDLACPQNRIALLKHLRGGGEDSWARNIVGQRRMRNGHMEDRLVEDLERGLSAEVWREDGIFLIERLSSSGIVKPVGARVSPVCLRHVIDKHQCSLLPHRHFRIDEIEGVSRGEDMGRYRQPHRACLLL